MALPHEDTIFQRLEATKKYGLVSEYPLSWSGGPHEYKPKGTVWPNGSSTEDVVKGYIGKLLRGFVSDPQIIVARN